MTNPRLHKVKLLLLLAALYPLLLAATSTARAEEFVPAPIDGPRATFTTSKVIGETIRLSVESEQNNLWIDLNGNGRYDDGERVEYNSGTIPITNQTFTIYGDLTKLECYNEQLTSLDVGKLPNLTKLECYSNQLTSLDVSKLTNLERISCYNNQLTSLDVSKLTNLERISCYNNQLTSLDVSKLTNLTKLECYSNQIKQAEMQKIVEALPKVGSSDDASLYPYSPSREAPDENECTHAQVVIAEKKGWKVLYPDGKPFPAPIDGPRATFTTSKAIGESISLFVASEQNNLWIDLNGNGRYDEGERAGYYDRSSFTITNQTFTIYGDLKRLYCSENQLTSLDVSKLTNLERISCYNNQLTSLDVSKLTNLMELDCYSNQLTSLDVSKLTNLTKLECYSNQLTSLSLDNLPNLERLSCNSNQLTSLTLSNLQNLSGLSCYKNRLTSLSLDNLPKLPSLDCDNNQLTSLSLDNLPNLEGLSCDSNQLTSLSLDNLPNLERLSCNSNQLTSLSLDNLPKLPSLDCDNNQLTSLILSRLNNLSKLSCSNNQLTSLDVSKLTNLKELSCYNNQLTSLDVSKLTNLKELSCYNNQLTSLDVSSMPNLSELSCYKNRLTSLTLSKLNNLDSLDCRDNQLTSLDLSMQTKLRSLDCDSNQLTSLKLSKLNNLERLVCFNNQLSSLNVGLQTKLEHLKCYQNQIKASEMQKLVEGLPTATKEARFYPYNLEEEAHEQNQCTPEQVKIAMDKGWRVLNPSNQNDFPGLEVESFAVTTTKEGKGTLKITGAADLNAVELGTKLMVVATPAEGWLLKSLTANDVDIVATKSFAVTEATVVKAVFVDRTTESFAVTLKAGTGGVIAIEGKRDEELKAIPYGTTLTVAVAPDAKMKLAALTANNVDIMATKQFTVTSATEVVASFITGVGKVGRIVFKAYPNPAESNITIEAAPLAEVRLYTLDGALQLTKRTNEQGICKLNVSHLQPGNYLLIVGSLQRQITIK